MSPYSLIHVVPSGEWGAPERYAFDLCRHFSDAGWTVQVLTRDVKAVDHRFAEAGIEVSHAPLRQYPDYYSAKSMARLFTQMPRGKGIVHVHRYNEALTCILARKLARRPDIRLVATRHKSQPGKDSLLRRIIYRGIDSHLFVSEYSKNIFYQGWAPGRSPLKEEKTAVVFNSLLDAPLEPYGEPGKGPVSAVYKGKLKPGKGLESLIDAFSLLGKTKVRLRILGHGEPDYVDALRQRAERAGISDKIDWNRDTDFNSEKMAGAHFGVFPTETPDSFGMANMEFMAYGKPQISTFTGSEREILDAGKDSIEIPPSQPTLLADAISRLATDASLRKEMGRNAFKRYNELYSWPKFIERIRPHYQSSELRVES